MTKKTLNIIYITAVLVYLICYLRFDIPKIITSTFIVLMLIFSFIGNYTNITKR